MIFSLKLWAEIRYWFNVEKETIYVQHIPSGTIEIIDDPDRIIKFVKAYNLDVSDCKRIREDKDKLGIFMKLKIDSQAKSS